MTDMTCPICLAPLLDADTPAMSLVCGHAFHQICMRTYCESQGCIVAQVRCPSCKLTEADVQRLARPTPAAPASWLANQLFPDADSEHLESEVPAFQDIFIADDIEEESIPPWQRTPAPLASGLGGFAAGADVAETEQEPGVKETAMQTSAGAAESSQGLLSYRINNLLAWRC